jgi:type III restriction enzyme
MSNPFFDHRILNSPYEYPVSIGSLMRLGNPRRRSLRPDAAPDFTPIPKPKKRKAAHPAPDEPPDAGNLVAAHQYRIS